jgi:hypothetical protein
MNYVKFVALALLALVTFKVAFSLMGDMGPDGQTGNGLIVEPRIVDVGTVTLNQGVNFATSMRNNSQKPIKVARLERSCHCLSASTAKDTCQPGETVTISGTIVAEKLGRFRHLFKVIEEDTSAPEHVIEVVGNAVTGTASAASSGSSNP